MLVTRLIERKRDGLALSPEEWKWFVNEYTRGSLPDYQAAALMMACFLNGLEEDELIALTGAMVDSGSRMKFPRELRPVDKHSTGGVGDKTSLVLAPLVAGCGVPVPMMSGRGLGHTTGTLDKLESIPGFRTDLALDRAVKQVERIGCALIGQTREIAPADGKLYALRDATATVEAIPLIAASIMSKKIAESLAGLVLDVKNGSGAFLPSEEDALELAQTMIALGEAAGCRTTALVTAMDRPLGRACGNALEMREAILSLRGEGPEDLVEVTLALSAEMLMLGLGTSDPAEARQVAENALSSGRALEKFEEIVEAQGGDPRVAGDPDLLPRAPLQREYRSATSGHVRSVEPRRVGWGIVELGGGRKSVDEGLDYAVGFEILVRPAQEVEAGQTLAVIHAADADGLARGEAALGEAITVSEEKPGPGLARVSRRVTRRGVELLS